MSFLKTEEYEFRILLLRLSTLSLIDWLLTEPDERRAEIVYQEIRARGPH